MELKDFKLVVTCAVIDELPKEFLKQQGVAILSLKAALSHDIRALKKASKGILFLITGVGRNNSTKAIKWIKDNLSPLFVLNIGAAALVNHNLALGQWYQPIIVVADNDIAVRIDSRIPIPVEEGIINKAEILYSSIRPAKHPVSKDITLIDMEAFWQAKELQNSNITFHCIKYATDRAGAYCESQYKQALAGMKRSVIRLFKFLNTSKPSFTVIIPAYNRASRLKEAIDSVKAQTYPPKKIVVVDDGSTDNTKEVLRAYNRSVTSVFLKNNYGVSIARMVGASLAKTEWVAFLDSDDRWHRDKLLFQADFIEKYPFYEILQSEEIWIRQGRRVNPCKYHQKPEGWAWPQALRRCLISPSGVVLKKSLLQNLGGFREDYPVCEDFDLWLRITRFHPVGLVKEPSVIKFGGHEDQLSRAYPALDRYRLKSLLELYLKEEEEHFKRLLREAIIEQTQILLKGAIKRTLIDDVKYYKSIMRFVTVNKG